jgi:hypothetical protein
MPTSTAQVRTGDAGSYLLNVRLELQQGADDAHLRRFVEEHLQRFGFREELRFLWTTTTH